MTEGRLAREHPELLARFLEGDLAQWEHSKLLAEFADDPESMAVLLDAEAALQEVGGLTLVREPSRPASRAPLLATAAMAVATAAALLVVGPFGGPSNPAGASAQPGPSIDRIAAFVSGDLPAGWHVIDLPVQRGGMTMREEAVGIRLGALATTLSVAVSRGDTNATIQTLQAIKQSLAPLPGVGPARSLLAGLEESTSTGSAVSEHVDPLTRALDARFGTTAFAAGQAAEHARLVDLAGATPAAPEWLISSPRQEPVLRDLGALFGLDNEGVIGSASDFGAFLIRYAAPSSWDF